MLRRCYSAARNLSVTALPIGLFTNCAAGAQNLEAMSRGVHQTAGDASFSSLWHDGFNIVHAKVSIIGENTGKHNWIPAISGGFLLRTQVDKFGRGNQVNADPAERRIQGYKTQNSMAWRKCDEFIGKGFRCGLARVQGSRREQRHFH